MVLVGAAVLPAYVVELCVEPAKTSRVTRDMADVTPQFGHITDDISHLVQGRGKTLGLLFFVHEQRQLVGLCYLHSERARDHLFCSRVAPVNAFSYARLAQHDGLFDSFFDGLVFEGILICLLKE